MVLNPPEQFPDWCEEDQVDPVSNENNAIPPTPELVQFGWPRMAYPARNFINYLARWTGNWIRYLAQNDSKSRTIITFCSTNGGNSDGPIVKVPLGSLRPIVMIYINDTASGNADTFYIGMYTTNSNNTVSVNEIASNDISVTNVDKDTGILNSITSTASTPGPFNIVAVQYDSFF